MMDELKHETWKELSPKMIEAIEHMRKYGGKLQKFRAGYWAVLGHVGHYGTSTVEAIVRRGKAEYTVWKDGRGGKFPIEVSLVAAEK